MFKINRFARIVWLHKNVPRDVFLLIFSWRLVPFFVFMSLIILQKNLPTKTCLFQSRSFWGRLDFPAILPLVFHRLRRVKDNLARMSAYKIVMIRHGESEWNQENRFCGWFDANLSDKGVSEAKQGGQVISNFVCDAKISTESISIFDFQALKDEGWKFDVAHTSLLTR